MNPHELDEVSRAALGRRIEAARNDRGLTLEQLAKKAGHDIKTVRALIAGRKVQGNTRANVCKVLGLDCTDITLRESSDEGHGGYARSTFLDYIGYFHAYRWDFHNSGQILRYVVEISWDDPKKCLFFKEYQRRSEGSRLDERRDHSQSGDIFFSIEVGLLHFLTVHRGAMRLLTVSKFRLENEADLTLQGILLTQAKRTLHYQPCTSPIILKKLNAQPSEADLSCSVLIGPDDPLYERLHRGLFDVEKNVARFALAPDLGEMLTGAVLNSARVAGRKTDDEKLA